MVLGEDGSDGMGGGKVDGGADRTTRELEGPKETTEKMAEGERAGKVEKGRTENGCGMG